MVFVMRSRIEWEIDIKWEMNEIYCDGDSGWI
jgi:hypothetical protein